jgi:hypothetical protein
VARLNAVAPDGSSVRLTYGVVNLDRLPEGAPEVVIDLDYTAFVVPAGHRCFIRRQGRPFAARLHGAMPSLVRQALWALHG